MKRALALILAAVAVAVACSNNDVHPFSAYAYDPDRDCLEAPAAVDVISGPDDGPCTQLRCWESPGHDIYITETACSAPSDYKDETKDETGICPAALNAYGRTDHGLCPAGTGGSGGS